MNIALDAVFPFQTVLILCVKALWHLVISRWTWLADRLWRLNNAQLVPSGPMPPTTGSSAPLHCHYPPLLTPSRGFCGTTPIDQQCLRHHVTFKITPFLTVLMLGLDSSQFSHAFMPMNWVVSTRLAVSTFVLIVLYLCWTGLLVSEDLTASLVTLVYFLQCWQAWKIPETQINPIMRKCKTKTVLAGLSHQFFWTLS